MFKLLTADLLSCYSKHTFPVVFVASDLIEFAAQEINFLLIIFRADVRSLRSKPLPSIADKAKDICHHVEKPVDGKTTQDKNLPNYWGNCLWVYTFP